MEDYELSDIELECITAGKGLSTPQVFGRMFTTRPFQPLFGWNFWERHFVAK